MSLFGSLVYLKKKIRCTSEYNLGMLGGGKRLE